MRKQNAFPISRPLPDVLVADAAIRKMAGTWVVAGLCMVLMGGPAVAKDTQAASNVALWSLKPLARPTVPSVRNANWSRNPIDHFILQELESERLDPAPPAERRELIRRVYFDLIGLPPSPQAVDAFIRDTEPDAYLRLIDRLLDDPRYGEKWARHWLDVVRYAESDGYKSDLYRPAAWRYRDYVIDAFNRDKPYDRFVQEQLAGDELFPGDLEAQVATGYLRHGPYEDNQANVEAQWELILTEITDTTAEVFLGLSMGCARCHNHKFDPILQSDYYRFRAFFEALVPRTDLLYATDSQRAEHDRQLAAWKRATKPAQAEIQNLVDKYRPKLRAQHIARYPKPIQTLYEKLQDDLTPREKQLVHLAEIQTSFRSKDIYPVMSKEDQQRWTQLHEQLKEYDSLKPDPLPPLLGVSNLAGAAPLTHMPGSSEALRPGVPSVLTDTAEVGSAPDVAGGRRAALARWLTLPDNGLAARVIVNRIWHYHFGRGLVATTSDFGHLGDPPTHPQLLDYLAADFVAEGWSLKQLHRRIVTSATYRQSAMRSMPPAARRVDPENRLLWRMPARRLNAEQTRDAMLAVSGELDPTAGGPAADHTSQRRSIYLKVMRNTPEPLLQAFDCPSGFGSTPVRNITTTAPQALLMLNGQWVLNRAEALAARLAAAKPGSAQAQVTLAYRLVLGRGPDDAEMAEALIFLTQQQTIVKQNASEGEGDRSDVAALVDFCHALLNSNGFLYLN